MVELVHSTHCKCVVLCCAVLYDVHTRTYKMRRYKGSCAAAITAAYIVLMVKCFYFAAAAAVAFLSIFCHFICTKWKMVNMMMFSMKW